MRPLRSLTLAAARPTALLAALVPAGFLSLIGVLAEPAMAFVPTNPRLPALTRTPFSVNGQILTVQISDDVAGNAVAGLAQIPTGAAAYLTIQQCTLNETGCTNVPSSARSYPAGGSNTTPITGAVTPVNGSTYRTCAIVNVSGVTGGACSNWAFQGGSAFLSTITLTPPNSGYVGARTSTMVLGDEMESLHLVTWICNGSGANCSIATQQSIRSYLPPIQSTWSFNTPLVASSFGHTYKACAIITVQGATAGACTPLVAY